MERGLNDHHLGYSNKNEVMTGGTRCKEFSRNGIDFLEDEAFQLVDGHSGR